jgi:imidazolonepropionase-like amidohydrolase
MSPAAALKTATADAAALLGISSRAGTITIGKDADLLIVDGDPLRDISALRRVISVLRRGAIVKSRD